MILTGKDFFGVANKITYNKIAFFLFSEQYQILNLAFVIKWEKFWVVNSSFKIRFTQKLFLFRV